MQALEPITAKYLGQYLPDTSKQRVRAGGPFEPSNPGNRAHREMPEETHKRSWMLEVGKQIASVVVTLIIASFLLGGKERGWLRK